MLRESDVAAAAPTSFRARLRIQAPDRREPAEIEVWRSGEARTLVRFLAPKERGKYLLYEGGSLWFLAPGSKKPVKLPPQFRLQGSATLDDILGLRYSRDFRIADIERTTDAEGPLLAFQLEAVSPKAPYPSVLYVVRPKESRPLRAEYRLKSGRTSTIAEFAEWAADERLRLRRLLLKDMLRGGATTEVVFLAIEGRAVPDALFDLEDGSERRRLEAEAVP